MKFWILRRLYLLTMWESRQLMKLQNRLAKYGPHCEMVESLRKSRESRPTWLL